MEQLELKAVEDHEAELAREKAEEEARIERQQVEQVFGLTGGELDDKPWEFPDVEVGEVARYRYWYDGVPEWCASDFPDLYEVEHRTVVTDHETPETLREADGTMWFRVKSFESSGETECCWVGCEDTEGFNERPCKFCEAQEGEDHGHIYLGEGWREVVYQQDPVREVMES